MEVTEPTEVKVEQHGAAEDKILEVLQSVVAVVLVLVLQATTANSDSPSSIIEASKNCFVL